MKLEGFGIFVKDMPTMVRFYRDVLGFEIKEEEDSSNVYLVKDGTLFLLYRRTDFEQMAKRSFSYANGIHVGDITKLDGAKLPPVDVICGGSPCQDYAEEKVIPKFKPPPL